MQCPSIFKHVENWIGHHTVTYFILATILMLNDARTVRIYQLLYPMLLPHAHAQGVYKAIGFVCHLSVCLSSVFITKITRSRVLCVLLAQQIDRYWQKWCLELLKMA